MPPNTYRDRAPEDRSNAGQWTGEEKQHLSDAGISTFSVPGQREFTTPTKQDLIMSIKEELCVLLIFQIGV